MCTLKLSLVDVCSLEKGNFLTSMKNDKFIQSFKKPHGETQE